MKTLSFVLPLCLSLAACGGNPVTVAKERDRADKRVRERDAANAELTERNDRLSTALQNATETEHYVWAIPSIATLYSDAVALCDDIGFELPTTAQLAEFKTDVYDKSPNWQQVAFDRFFAADAVEDHTDIFGFALCVRPVNDDVLAMPKETGR